MTDSNIKTGNYNLRENPKRSEKARERSGERSKNVETEWDENTEEVREITEQNHTKVQGKIGDKTTTGTDEAGVSIITDGRDLEHGDFLNNPNGIETVRSRDPNEIILMMLKQIQEQTRQQNDKLNSKLDEQTDKLNSKLDETKNQIEQGQETLLLEVRAEINNIKEEMKEEISRQINVNNNGILNAVEDRINEFEINMNEKQRECREDCIKNTVDTVNQLNKLNVSKIKQCQEEIRTNQNEIKKINESNEAKFVNINSEIRQIKNNQQINETKLQEVITNRFNLSGGNTINTGTQPIINLTCPNYNYNESIPKFSGKEKNPLEFLQKIKRFQDKVINRRGQEHSSFGDMLESALIEHAAKWWQVISKEVDNMEEFEKRFLSKYWNSEIQRGIRRRMEMENYRPQGTLRRTEYFLERVIILQNLTPVMDEEEIVSFLCEQFSERIRDAKRVQNIKTIAGFEQLLNSEDIDERNRRSRNQQLEYGWRGEERRNTGRVEGHYSERRNNNPYNNRGWHSERNQDRDASNNNQNSYYNRQYHQSNQYKPNYQSRQAKDQYQFQDRNRTDNKTYGNRNVDHRQEQNKTCQAIKISTTESMEAKSLPTQNGYAAQENR